MWKKASTQNKLALNQISVAKPTPTKVTERHLTGIFIRTNFKFTKSHTDGNIMRTFLSRHVPW